ncbi:hypothetical protein DICPUDRAFT_41848, partial [Dictyostelium purpureum]
NSLNGESVSPNNRLGCSPNSPVSKPSSFDLNGKKTTKSNVVKYILSRNGSSNSLMGKKRGSGSDAEDEVSSTPDSPKLFRDKEHSSSIGSNSSLDGSVGRGSLSGSLGIKKNGSNLSVSTNINNNDGANVIDRSLWTVKSLKEHPQILDIMERVKPVNRAVSFGQIYASEETQFEFDPLIGKENILQLILQHLQFEGLLNSKKVMEEEARINYPEYAINESRLVTLLRAALKDSDKVFELAMDNKLEKEASMQQLEEHLTFLGLFKDESQNTNVQDINIYDEPETNIIYFEEKDKDSSNNTNNSKESPTLNGSGLSQSSIGLSSSMSQQQIQQLQSHNSSQQAPSTPPPSKSSSSSSSTAASTGPQVKAASLNILVTLLTPENNHDLEYTKTFLLTYQSFTTPEMLLQKLIQRYHVPQKPGQSVEAWRQRSTHIQLRVVNVLKTWIKDYFSDFSEKLVQAIKTLLESMRHSGNTPYAKVISDALNSGLKKSGRNNTVFTVSAPEPKVPKNIWSHQLDIFSVDEEEISRQLTLMDFEIFSNIKATELLNQSWNKPKLRHRSPNVLSLIARFNEISEWTASSILSYERVKDRARIMAKFIKIAEYCMKSLNNFNTSMAILSGLNASSIHRLKFTKEEMPKHTMQVYQDLQQQLSSAQAYKEYRALLAKSNPPCLPYLGVYLTDLTFFEDGNPDFIQGFINFGKRKLIYGSISNVQSFQNTKYNLQPVYQIAKLLTGFKLLNENELYSRSMTYEPRNKERSEIL